MTHQAHVKGVVYWHQAEQYGVLDRRPGYRAQFKRIFHYVEFINHSWYILEKRGDEFATRRELQVPRTNEFGLGWWNDDDEENPNGQTNVHTVDTNPVEQLVASFGQLQPLDTHTGLTNSDDENDAAAPVSATLPAFPTYAATAVAAPTAPAIPIIMAAPPPPLTGGLKGIAPAVFTGDRGKSKQFLREFHHTFLLARKRS
ncbi:hypothetical protein EDB85DRAFT_1895245 [Lactarius pseudohatsudake]|nr:hypothetical protein EDB85DRAFT_1895245 [Lactarius pseudohatsudake]